MDRAQQLVVSVLHNPRVLQRVVTSICTRGYAIEALSYRRARTGRTGICVVSLERHLASRELETVARTVEGCVDVLWAQPLSSVPVAAAPTMVSIDHYEVTVRGTSRSGASLARLRATVDSVVHLAADQAETSFLALVAAFGVLDEHLRPTRPRLAFSVSPPVETGHGGAWVVAEARRGGVAHRLAGTGQDGLGAVAQALGGLLDAAVRDEASLLETAPVG